MHKLQILFLLALLVLSASPLTTTYSIFSSVSIDNVYWGSPSNPTLVGPTTSYATLVLNIKNIGDSSIYNTSVTIHISKPFYYYSNGLQKMKWIH